MVLFTVQEREIHVHILDSTEIAFETHQLRAVTTYPYNLPPEIWVILLVMITYLLATSCNSSKVKAP